MKLNYSFDYKINKTSFNLNNDYIEFQNKDKILLNDIKFDGNLSDL